MMNAPPEAANPGRALICNPSVWRDQITAFLGNPALMRADEEQLLWTTLAPCRSVIFAFGQRRQVPARPQSSLLRLWLISFEFPSIGVPVLRWVACGSPSQYCPEWNR
jgi:hypothetical protein